MEIREAEKLGIEKATEESLKIIKSKSELNAILSVNDKPKLSKSGSLNVPYICKDNIVTKELPTTAASKILEGFVSPYEATVVMKLREAGAVMVGKSNLDEFAMGSSTENSAFGPTKNPHDPTRVPGGSSGGSAAAVAAGMASFALGSDTGGSIRQPASFCGVVGLMPTYGRVSRYGLIAMASSLDRIGPITTNVKDAARVLRVIAGHDEHDSTTMAIEVPDYVAALDGDIKDLKIGVPKGFFDEGVDAPVAQAVQAAVDKLRQLGAIVSEIELPHAKFALATYYILQPSEVSANLARYDGIRYGLSASDAKNLWEVYDKSRAQGFGAEVKRRIMLGTYTLSAGFRDAYYDKAQRVRTLINAGQLGGYSSYLGTVRRGGGTTGGITNYGSAVRRKDHFAGGLRI
ncbi:MAG: Glutamyl-tRNA(Gln) amidotransferase subunit A [candidate division Kazan bacterium GW2011_GWC1_52_13]|nr:MAG: Glutamyl-tRNA(Gln) amidotransferase subunit A [candidate division Kazan bacterium GW2011_GWC1_52_13]